MRRNLRRFRKGWSKLAIAGVLTLSSADVAATGLVDEVEVSADALPHVEDSVVKDLKGPMFNVGEDRFDKKLKLNLAIEAPTVILRMDGKLNQPIRFYLYNNYPSFIRSYRISIYDGKDRENVRPLQTLTGETAEGWITWDGALPKGQIWEPDHQYKAVLEVLGIDGKKDIVNPLFFQTVSVEDAQLDKFKNQTDPYELPGYGVDRTYHRGVLPDGQYGKIVIQASRLWGASDIALNGTPLIADASGRLMRELILPAGEHKVTLTWKDEQGASQRKEETITISTGKKKDFFFVGMADLTASKNRVTGPGQSILSVDERFDGGTHWDSRVMFYLKGDTGNRTRLTAHLDTGEEELSDVFRNIGDKDPRRFTRELNALEHYPIYGDNSTTVSDVDTQGKFYLKLERDKTHFLWGNYNSNVQGTELAAYNRSLYGAQFLHESKGTTKYGSPKQYATLFAAIGETRGSHNEFASTGGSLYFLKHQRVTTGSLKITAEDRDSNTGRVISRRDLQEGIDYEVDNFQGRIILTRPIPMNSNSGSIISGNGLLSGNNVYLVADYEYYSDGLDMDGQNTYGLRASSWLGDHFRIGGNYIQEEKETGGNYKLIGFDATWRPYRGTFTNFEYVSTTNSLGEIFQSTNGGINFTAVPGSDEKDGKAWKIEQVVDFSEFTKSKMPLTFDGYYVKKNKGFANFTDSIENDIVEYGGELRYDFIPNQKSLAIKHTFEKETDTYQERITSIFYKEELQPGLRGTLEFQDRRENNHSIAGTTRETLGAFKIEKDLQGGRHKVYGILQGTMSREGDVEDNNKLTLGIESQVQKNLRLGLEGFTSNRGEGGAVNVTYDVNERASFYTKVSNDIDSSSGRQITTTVGTNFKATSKLDIYSEKQFESLRAERSTSDIYGVRYKPSSNHNFELSYGAGQVKKSGSLTNESDITKRDVWTLGYGFDNPRFEYRTKLEFRKEKGNENLEQWVTTNRIKTTQTGAWSWMGQFDYAKTTGTREDETLTDFTEAAIGFAYRPINHDKFNLFGKITYISGLDPEDQFNKSSSDYSRLDEDDYEQRSMVYSLEGVYELSPKLEVAFKGAHRKGELRYRGEKEWFSSGASLYAGRLNYKLNKYWQAQIEYRTLSVDTADDRKSGWVTSIYRNLGAHGKIGVGYNWTDYNDDLTRLNYTSKGWFVNLVGKW